MLVSAFLAKFALDTEMVASAELLGDRVIGAVVPKTHLLAVVRIVALVVGIAALVVRIAALVVRLDRVVAA